MTRRRWIIIGVAGTVAVLLGLGLLAAVIGRALSAGPAATPVPPRTVSVVVATRDIPLRGLLQPDDLTVIDVPVQLAPLQVVSDPEQAIGRITMVPLVTGETLIADHLADPSNYAHDLAFVIDDDQVLMAFPASDLMSRLNVLRPGDLVDIFATMSSPLLPAQGEEGGSATFTFDAMQQVGIQAVVVDILQPRQTTTASSSAVRLEDGSIEVQAQPTPTPAPTDLQPDALLLALDPQDALVLKYIKDNGGVIDIVLRAPTATVRFELSPVMAEYLRDRFELVITR